MKKQTIGTLIVTATMLSASIYITPVGAESPQPPTTISITKPSHVHAEAFSRATINTIHPELAEQLKTRKAGSVKFWEAVSWCETNHKWNDGGYYAGGLGIAKSTWRGYGGRQFANSPKDATKEEQIVVANRIAFLGFQTKNQFRTLEDKQNNKPFFRPAVGWKNMTKWGKGCVNWRTRKPARDRYTEAGMAEWKKSRPAPPVVKDAGLSGSVSSQGLRANEKRCPRWEAKLKEYGLPVKKFSYIMWRESRCEPKAIGWNYKPGMSHRNCKLAPADIYKKCKAVKSYDSGLLQVNSTWKTLTARVCGTKWGDMTPLLTPECNLKVAKALYEDGGYGHWSATSGINP